MTLLDEARAAHAAHLEQVVAEEKAARQALRQDALAAVRATLTGATPAALDALKPVHTDLTAQLVVVSDGTVHLAVNRRDKGAWTVRLAQFDSTRWGPIGGFEAKIDSLADLGGSLT